MPDGPAHVEDFFADLRGLHDLALAERVRRVRDAPTTPHPVEAVRHAKDARAWTGLPEVAWSIVLQASLRKPISIHLLDERLATASETLPTLGPPARVRAIGTADLPAVRGAFADTRYAEGRPAIRAGVVEGEHPVLLLAGHHGALDGLGLVGLLGMVLGAPVISSVRGLAIPPMVRWRPAAVA